MNDATAIANANVALAKYWGKRDERLNLPYTGSISMTLQGLETRARVGFATRLQDDRFQLNGQAADGSEAHRFRSFLDVVRRLAGHDAKATVEIETNFPVAAGLASSASTFAALALAASAASNLNVSAEALSRLARLGSGSAARSVHGGYAEWLTGEAADGADCFAVPLAPADHWPLGVVIAVTDLGRKRVGSREGMALVVKQSPFFPAWLESHEADLDAIRAGVRTRDLELVGRTAEHNCLKMHAVSLAARPSLFYWTPATVAVIERVAQLRAEGLQAYFSIDAGPQVKILCHPADRTTVAEAIRRVDGVQRILLSEPGPGVRLVTTA